MESPLLDDTELMDINDDELSADTVLNNYKILLENGRDIHDKAHDIIQAIGGIDFVLKYHLINNNNMSVQQLQEINNILLSSNKIQTNPDNIEYMDTKDIPTMYLSINDTMMHRLWKSQKATTLWQFLTGRIMSYFGIFIGISLAVDYCIVTYFWGRFSNEIGRILDAYSTISMLICIIFMSINVTYVNIKAAKQVLTSFEQWFKLFYYIRGSICWNIWAYRVYGYRDHLAMLNINVTFLGYLLLFFMYTMIDGYYVPNKYRSFMIVFGSLMFSIMAISFTYYEVAMDDPLRVLNVAGLKWDLLDYASNSMRVVSIFIWKQTIYSLWKPQHAVLIQKSVALKWI